MAKNDERIINIVLDYLKENIYSYAIMIDGEWGSGKTFFAKNILLPRIKSLKDQKAIYVSLYGIDSVNTINKRVFTTILEEYPMGKEDKPIKVFSKLGVPIKIIMEAVGNKIGSKTIVNFDVDLIASFISLDKYCLIFDDIERCNVPISDILGFINYYVEHKGVKAILISNEKEIENAEMSEEVMYKVILNSIKTTEEKEADEKLVIASGSKELLASKSEIVKFIKQIAEENSNYNRVKEKLVGQTLHYAPDLKIIVPNLANNVFTINNHVAFDNEKFIEHIIEILESENHFNIRTLQFSLSLYSKLVILIEGNFRDDKHYNKLLIDSLNATLYVSIAYKNGIHNYIWNQNSEFGNILISNSRIIDSFKFIHDYIYEGIFEEERIIKVYGEYCLELSRQNTKENEPMKLLKEYWNMEDDEIIVNTKKILENLTSNQYSGTTFRWIISLIFKLKSIGFDNIDSSDYVEVIKEKLRAGERMQSYYEPLIDKNDKYFPDYERTLLELSDIESLTVTGFNRSELNSIIDGKKGWGINLYQYYLDNRDDIGHSNGFFKFIDLNNCEEVIRISKVSDISDFRKTFHTIYNSGYALINYRDDIECLKELRERLSKNSSDVMKEYNIKWLKEDINSFITQVNLSNDKISNN